MIFVLLDTLIFTITGKFLCLFLMRIHFMDKYSFLFSCALVYLLNNNFFIIFTLILIYIIDSILFKYTKFNLLMYISTFTFYYFILSDNLNSYFINLFLIILLYFYKYNYVGEKYEREKIR